MTNYSSRTLCLQMVAAVGLLLAGGVSDLSAQTSSSTHETGITEANQAGQDAQRIVIETRQTTAAQSAQTGRQAELERAEFARAAAEDSKARLAEQEAQVAEAQRQVEEAGLAMAEAARALEEQRRNQNSDMEKARAELSRAHRALREASREVAMAHRKAEIGQRLTTRVQTINLGDRAVIGVLLGESSERGVMLAGVSPGGPAEQAGLKKGDLLTSIRETDLTDRSGDESRDMLVKTMTDVKADEEIRIGFIRDGKSESLMVKAEQREPSSWQSMIRLPDDPDAPGAPNAPDAPSWTTDTSSPQVIVEHIQVPDGSAKVMVIDEAALKERIADIEGRVESFQYMFIDDDGTRIEFNEDIDVDDEHFSRIGGNALNEANLWFGLSHTAGLELASLNPELGAYFKADSGVLVVSVKDSNSYGLKSGDVILSVADTKVTSPAELIRALRVIEPDAEFEMKIKRERRDKTLKAKLPDNRLGNL